MNLICFFFLGYNLQLTTWHDTNIFYNFCKRHHILCIKFILVESAFGIAFCIAKSGIIEMAYAKEKGIMALSDRVVPCVVFSTFLWRYQLDYHGLYRVSFLRVQLRHARFSIICVCEYLYEIYFQQFLSLWARVLCACA